jgi:starch phosphorylase
VREYTEKQYLPAAISYLDRAAGKGAKGRQIAEKLESLGQKWNSIHFGVVKTVTIEEQHRFDVEVYFHDAEPDMVKVELFANGMNGGDPFVQKMTRGVKLEGTTNGYMYYASVAANRPSSEFTARITPDLPGVSIPLEFPRILWQR